MEMPISGRRSLRQLELALQDLQHQLDLHAIQTRQTSAKAPLARAQQARQQLDQALCEHLTVLREAELALSCVQTLLLWHDEESFPGKQIRLLLKPFQQQMEPALHGLEGLR
ncbi:DUF1484 family protein [Chromobacterium haemolyticum]|uniref:DUF1484 family protein n=1 Tax=Chromobacterium haemolyticum TaxID=394935 RepID=UPI0002FA4F87|nr:DUF1484 family protein [Chromobacterium haemolyticum]